MRAEHDPDLPPDFVLLGSKTDQEQMIGNAVPVKLAEYVGRHLRTYIEQQAAGRAAQRSIDSCSVTLHPQD